MKRRDFIKIIARGTLGGWILGIIGTIFSFLKIPRVEGGRSENEIEVGSSELLKIGEGKFVSHFKTPVWVVKTEGGYIALSAVCTHMKCILEYDKKEKVIKCPCHAGVFDLNGNVIKGPPPSPLRKYRVEIRGNKVYVLF